MIQIKTTYIRFPYYTRSLRGDHPKKIKNLAGIMVTLLDEKPPSYATPLYAMGHVATSTIPTEDRLARHIQRFLSIMSTPDSTINLIGDGDGDCLPMIRNVTSMVP